MKTYSTIESARNAAFFFYLAGVSVSIVQTAVRLDEEQGVYRPCEWQLVRDTQ